MLVIRVECDELGCAWLTLVYHTYIVHSHTFDYMSVDLYIIPEIVLMFESNILCISLDQANADCLRVFVHYHTQHTHTSDLIWLDAANVEWMVVGNTGYTTAMQSAIC